MSFGNILGQMLQSGLGGATRTHDRVASSASRVGGGGSGGGSGDILASLQNAIGGAGAGGTGGLADRARDFLGNKQAGGFSGAQIGGMGALAGGVLGGGLGGAARGGALAMLGALALGALRNAQAQKSAAPDGGGETITLDPSEVSAVTSPAAEKLMVRAMISAAKADGNIDQSEMEKIIGKVGDEGVSADERAYVMSQLAAPVDVDALVADVQGQAQAAEVYAASLLAIDVDSEAERDYLRTLAGKLGLDGATVTELHKMTSAPAL